MDDVCCPRFTDKDVKAWNERTFIWKDKKFVKGKVFSLFYMPINFGAVMKKLDNAVTNAKGKIINNLCLSAHTSKWNMDVFLAVDREIPGEENVTMSGKVLSKVYEGDYKDTEKWCDDFVDYAKRKKVVIKNWFMWYTSCPKCAKLYGKNYTVIIAKV